MAINLPNWPEDFLDAHTRHWEDAELLFGQGRLANADHLYGLSAECGLKYLLESHGITLTRRERVHINHLWLRVRAIGNARRLLPPRWLQENLFDDWDISQRYANRLCFNQEFVVRHRRGADEIRRQVVAALRGGMRRWP